MIFESLITHLEASLNDESLTSLKIGIANMKKKIDDYWPLLKDIAALCMVIDPRFKLETLDTNGKKSVKTSFEKVFKKYEALHNEAISTQTCTQNSDSTKTKHKENPPSIVERYFLEIKGKISSSHKKSELALYLSEPRILFCKKF